MCQILLNHILYGQNKNVPMSFQKTVGMKKIESDFVFSFLGQCSHKATSNYNMQTEIQAPANQSLDVLQQFDQLLKNHSIVVSDRENLTKLFEHIVDLCTQMPKTKLKAAVKAATKEPKPKAQPKPKPKAQETMVGPEDAADAPVSSDLQTVPVARGRGRPRKTPSDAVGPAAKSADANPNAETAEKKRRGRPKKDKSVTISSNDDEDALIEQMMADVASMQKNEEPAVVHAHIAVQAHIAASLASPVDDDETESEGEMSPVVHESNSQMPSFVVEADVSSNVAATKPKAVKEAKPKAVKETKPKAVKEVKPKAVKEVKPKAVKEAKPKAVKEAKPNVEDVQPLASFSNPPEIVIPKTENHVVNGTIYLQSNFPTSSFTWNGRTYLRTETDNVYDNLTFEMIGVWDHANHEIICAFDDDDEMCFSDEDDE